MSDRPKNGAFTPPPHANAEVHRRIMAKLAKMTTEEIFQTMVHAGIYTQEGKLTAPYANDSDEHVAQPA